MRRSLAKTTLGVLFRNRVVAKQKAKSLPGFRADFSLTSDGFFPFVCVRVAGAAA
jgi:hypothetical protein